MKTFFDTEFLESQVFGEGEAEYEEENRITDGDRSDPDAEEEEIEEAEEIPVELTLNLEDGRTLCCRVSGVFMEQEKEYIALEADGNEDEGMIFLMGLSQGEEDELRLRPLEDEEEREAAFSAFFRMVEEEDYAAQAEIYAGQEGTEAAEPDAGQESEQAAESDAGQESAQAAEPDAGQESPQVMAAAENKADAESESKDDRD